MTKRLLTVCLILLFVGASPSARADDETPKAPASPTQKKKRKQPRQLASEKTVTGAVSADPILDDVDLKTAWEREARTRWTAPGISVTVPSAFGATWGTFYLGASFTNRIELSQNADGAVFFGTGFGNPEKYVGVEVSLSVVNLDPFGDDIAFNAKVHRSLGKGFAVAAGVENGVVLGGGIDQTKTYYLSLTDYFTLRASEMRPFSALMATVGFGNGRFTGESNKDRAARNLGAYTGVGLRALPWLGLSGAWTGRDIDAGISAAPFRGFRLSISAGVHDIAGISKRPRIFSLTFVYSESIFSDTFPFLTIRNF